MSFSNRVKRELYPIQKNYFTFIEKKLNISGYGLNESEGDDEDKKASIRGAFLLGGSVNDPSKSYHLEIVAKSESEAEELLAIMKAFGVNGRVRRRKDAHVVYLKDGTDIATLLGIMGAGASLMDFENARILNEMRGSVNRQVNCETANIKRTVKTSVRQIKAIRRIEEGPGLSSLPPALQEMARVRLAYPESSLSQLGGYLHPPVGKSGVNHRLRKLIEISDQIE